MGIVGLILLSGSFGFGVYGGHSQIDWFWIFIIGVFSMLGWFLFRLDHVIKNIVPRGMKLLLLQMLRVCFSQTLIIGAGFVVGYLFSLG